MKFSCRCPRSASIICSSSPVPSVATHQRLGLAAGEQRRAVGARQDADLGDDRAHRRRGRGRRCGCRGRGCRRARRRLSSSLNTPTSCAGRRVGLPRDRRARRATLRLGRVDRVVALGLAGDARRRRAGPRSTSSWTSAVERAVVGGVEVEGLLGGVLGQLDDRVDHRLDAARGRTSRRRASSSSVSSLASDSTIITASRVPATTRSSFGLPRSLRRASGSARTRRRRSRRAAPPIGPMNGTPESVRAAEAATMADDVGVVLEVVATARWRRPGSRS